MQKTQPEETIIVYPNRHYRARNQMLNDTTNGYISQKALKALVTVGTPLKFVKAIVTYEDVTAEYVSRITAYQEDRVKRVKPRQWDSYAG